jgi:hypothetical protein
MTKRFYEREDYEYKTPCPVKDGIMIGSYKCSLCTRFYWCISNVNDDGIVFCGDKDREPEAHHG